MMASVSLHFQGVKDAALPLTLLIVIAAVLAVWGVVQLACRRYRRGLVCLAAALGPAVFVPAMVVDAAARYATGNRRAGGASLLAAAAAALAAALAAMLVVHIPESLWMGLLAIEIALAVGVFYAAVYAYLGRARIAGLMLLRCSGILALMLILFKPALSIIQSGEGDKPFLPILVDRSGSMATTDEVNLPDRYQQAVRMLTAQKSRIERYFRPVWFHFARGVQSAESIEALGELTPSGQGSDGTNLAAAIRQAGSAYARSSLAGILLATDGIHNAPDVVTDAAVEAGVPVYAVAVGSSSERSSAQRNIELVSVDAPMEAVANNVTTITVRARIAGFATVPVEVQLLEEGADRPVNTERLWTDQNVATLTASLKWTPQEGPSAGSAATAPAASGPRGPTGPPAPAAPAAPAAPTAPGAPPPALVPTAGSTRPAADRIRRIKVVIPRNPSEAIAEDNDTDLHILLTEPHIRVLYVEGSMRPEYKYLRRLLSTDPNIRFMSLVRVTGNRFWSQGEIAGKRLDKLPETDAEFALFDVLILGDLDRTFLTSAQMSRIRKFVNDGGALLMLGGHNSLGPGGYGETEIEAVLPVILGARSQAQETTPFIPQLTAVGEEHPVFEGLKGFFHGPGGRKPDQKLPKLPDLLGCVTVVGPKPAASLLAIHPTRNVDGRPMVVLAVQRVGAGRAAAFTADTTWTWYLPLRGMGADSPYERFWGQLIRWLANVQTKARESKPAVVIRLDKTYMRVGQEAVKVLARVQDEKGRPPDNAQVACTITPAGGDGKPETLPLSPRLGDRLFELEYRPPKEGTYTLSVAAADSAGAKLGTDEQTLIVAPFSREKDILARNDGLLQMVAEKTDGRKADISGLPDLIDQIIRRQAVKGRSGAGQDEGRIIPLFDFPMLFLAFIALLTAEWLLRRRWNLR